MEKKMVGNNNLIDQKDLKRTLSTIGKNWYWFILFLGLSLAGSVFYLYKATKFYGVTTEILIKAQKDPLKAALLESMPTKPSDQDLTNEILVLSSTKMVDETVKKLGLDISYYIEGRIKTGEVYKGTPFEVQGKLLDYSFYETPISLKIINQKRFAWEINTEEYSKKGEANFGDPVVTSKFSFLVTPDSNVFKNNPRINEINYQFRFHDHKELVSKYKKRLVIEPIPDASAISISLEDEVMEKAIDFLNTLVNIYIENSISVNKQVNENTLAFIDGQLSQVENQLNGIESNLEQYQKDKTTFNLGGEQSVLFQRSVDFETERARMGIQLKSIDNMYEYLNSSESDLAISPAVLAQQNDPSLSSAFTELFALQQKRTNLLFSNTPSSPLVKQTDDQISSVKQNIMGLILNIRKKLTNDINSLSSQLNEYEVTMRQMPTTQRGIVNISRNVEIYSKIYEFLLETKAQTVISKAAIVADKIILEPAYFNGNVRPLSMQTIAGGFGLGIALSFLLVFIKGMFYNYINTKDELKDITDLSIIGVIGKSKEAGDEYLVVDKFPQSQIAEAFRVIRTNLSYFAPKVKSKILLVTSSVAGEGKTFCAVNIATTLAKAKKKVILVDLDLHKPKQANAFNLHNDVGITSYVVGKANLNQIIKDTAIENLQIILTGPRTPNASELIVDPMMDKLLEELKNIYEYIIIDTPPVGLLSDALVFMKHADLNLYVLKAGYSKRDFVDIAHQITEKNDIKHISFILNNVNAKNIPAGYGGGYYA
ncbi:MAG: polysaccharide biosynthesis tyrosine autokinase [Bacteroidetes bacterium]|jgi:tyrosine-protein kinase Etk/Wzc|nr:polysaccharide biosynthesis tyrosine autokinase [Bacteroidota bacterium]